MEQLNHQFLNDDSSQASTGVVGFDVLRAIVAMRQSGSHTARALAALAAEKQVLDVATDSAALISMFARSTAASARIGAFSNGNGDKAIVGQDERHA
jgi:hypothetical protein